MACAETANNIQQKVSVLIAAMVRWLTRMIRWDIRNRTRLGTALVELFDFLAVSHGQELASNTIGMRLFAPGRIAGVSYMLTSWRALYYEHNCEIVK